MAKFRTGQEVCWNWGEGIAKGKITEIYTSEVTKTLKGTEVTRNASEKEPAYLIEQDDGDQVLKSASEIETA